MPEPTSPRRGWRVAGWLLAPFVALGVLLAEEDLRGRWQLWQIKDAPPASALAPPADPLAIRAAEPVLAAADDLARLAKGNRLVSSGTHGLMKLGAPGRASCAYREARFPTFNGYRSADRAAPAAADDWLLANAQLASAAAPLDRLRAALQAPALALDGAPHPALAEAHFWLTSHGICALHGGNLDAAVDDIVAACALARLQRTDRRPEAQTAAETTDVFATLLTWEALQANGWNDERLGRLGTGARDGEPLTSALSSLRTQRALAPALFASARREAGGARALLWRLAWSHQDEARTLEQWGTFLAQAAPLAAERSWLAFAARYPKERNPGGALSPWRWPFSERLAPSSGRYLLASLTRHGAERQMALAAIALKRWELTGRPLPATLSALVPDLLPQLPLDDMDGQPLRYRLRPAGGYALYSVGLDGRDDGGDPSVTVGDNRVRSLWGGRDAVWPVFAPPAAK